MKTAVFLIVLNLMFIFAFAGTKDLKTETPQTAKLILTDPK